MATLLLKEFATYLRERGSDPTLHVVNQSHASGEESGGPLSAAEPKISQATLVEGSKLATIPVGSPTATGFTHFLDGIERTHLPCYWAMTPTLYGYTAAVIRQRDSNGRMSVWRALATENLFFPSSHIDPSDMRRKGLQVVDTTQDGEEPDDHPVAMLDKARKAVNKARGLIESQLAREWIDSHRSDSERWLVIDGSLTEVVDRAERANVIGIIKSHQTQYFAIEDQRKILSLAPGERSSVFAVIGRKRAGAYSWYLRLHSNVGRDVYFGLIRIEAAPSRETLEMADQLSRWLLAERSPLSLPDSRWDRLIYPIRDCEQYLRSIAPTRIMLEAAFSQL